VERLAQVVVRAEAQAGHPVERVAVDAGQVPVEHNDVVRTEVELGGCLQPVVGHVHRHALTGLRGLAIGPWSGLGVLGIWAAAALILGALALGLRDA
jgi:hypothetical protein